MGKRSSICLLLTPIKVSKVSVKRVFVCLRVLNNSERGKNRVEDEENAQVLVPNVNLFHI